MNILYRVFISKVNYFIKSPAIKAIAATDIINPINISIGNIRFNRDLPIDNFCTSDIPITMMTTVHTPIVKSINAENIYVEDTKNPFSKISTLLWKTSFPNSAIRIIIKKRTSIIGIKE